MKDDAKKKDPFKFDMGHFFQVLLFFGYCSTSVCVCAFTFEKSRANFEDQKPTLIFH